MWGASGAIRHWLDSIKPAMAATEESTKDQAQLLAEAWQAGKDALDTILEFIPKEQEQGAPPHFGLSPGNPASSCGLSGGQATHR